MAEDRSDRFKEIEDMYDGYQVNDEDGEKIGKVDDLFVDETDKAEYVGVKMGLLGMNSTLIPMDACRVDEENQTITVAAEKSHVQDGPDFDNDEAISSEFEHRVRAHYSLEPREEDEDRGAYGSYYSDDDDDRARSTEHDDDDDGGRESTERDDDDELRVERKEEELRAGTREREREDGGVKVRKRTRTDRERVRVPKKREEVSVERVSADDDDDRSDVETVEQGEAVEDGEEIRVPVKEEEVVAEKREVAKEEIRVKKDVVEDEEVIEEDVRKEEIDVEEGGEREDR